ncbi:hypothetical protein Bca4012_088261 [Brassica carinata]|uniref:Uncharacterized protein n=1 Tax=Brassica carinata TaxID=52824 RepID=A0A8X7PFQ8_BRACI|nr:hypothetical protein Bca52824_089745 [Brassica carinata]
MLCDKLKVTSDRVSQLKPYMMKRFKGTSVKKELVVQLDPPLREGYSKNMINFENTHACGSYRTTKHA